jgi:hypothetical protein
MKFSNGTEFRFGTTKYSRWTTGIFCFGGACFLLSRLIGQPVKEWADEIGMLAYGAALTVFLADMIAQRKAVKKFDDSK